MKEKRSSVTDEEGGGGGGGGGTDRVLRRGRGRQTAPNSKTRQTAKRFKKGDSDADHDSGEETEEYGPTGVATASPITLV